MDVMKAASALLGLGKKPHSDIMEGAYALIALSETNQAAHILQDLGRQQPSDATMNDSDEDESESGGTYEAEEQSASDTENEREEEDYIPIVCHGNFYPYPDISPRNACWELYGHGDPAVPFNKGGPAPTIEDHVGELYCPRCRLYEHNWAQRRGDSWVVLNPEDERTNREATHPLSDEATDNFVEMRGGAAKYDETLYALAPRKPLTGAQREVVKRWIKARETQSRAAATASPPYIVTVVTQAKRERPLEVAWVVARNSEIPTQAAILPPSSTPRTATAPSASKKRKRPAAKRPTKRTKPVTKNRKVSTTAPPFLESTTRHKAPEPEAVTKAVVGKSTKEPQVKCPMRPTRKPKAPQRYRSGSVIAK